MKNVRLGIIGMGNIGKYHADYLQNKKVNRCELVAVCDAVAPLDRYKPLKTFTDGETLIKSGEVDAVIGPRSTYKGEILCVLSSPLICP